MACDEQMFSEGRRVFRVLIHRSPGFCVGRRSGGLVIPSESEGPGDGRRAQSTASATLCAPPFPQSPSLSVGMTHRVYATPQALAPHSGLKPFRLSRTRCGVTSVSSTPVGGALLERRVVAGEPLRWTDELRDIRGQAALLFELVHRDLTVRYKRSFLGFFWTMLHPLLLMLIFVVIFANLFRARAPHYETYFLSAYVAWNFFAQTTVNAMAGVAWNGPLMKRVRVPLSIFTLSTILSGLVNLGLSLIVLFSIMLVVGAPLRPALLFLPVSLLLVGLFTFGVSLALTAVSVFFGDVREMVQAGMPALMYLTPIIYPISVVPDRFRWIFKLNPLVYIIEIVRDPIYYGIIPSPSTLTVATVMSLGSLAVGWMIFRHMAPRFHAHL
jgi:ABC-2 type transport system permease protein